MKILNLYSGIGGNRRLWDSSHTVTAVENNPVIAKVYQELFNNDEVITGDAVRYLEENYMNFDFIWASPPCVTHSFLNYINLCGYNNHRVRVPDMVLYGIILFLKRYYKGLWAVENVKPVYTPLIRPNRVLQRHLFWSNFDISPLNFEGDGIDSKKARYFSMYNLIKDKKGFDKRQVLRNCVYGEIGKYILECAEKKYTHISLNRLV